jgi:hypothetical protein
VDVNLPEQLSKFLDQSAAAADADASTVHDTGHSAHADVNAPRRPDFDSFECQGDLIRLDTLRKSSLTALSAGYEAAVAALPTLQEYAAALKEGDWWAQRQLQSQPQCQAHSADLEQLKTQWERANIVWNLITLEAFQAFQACPREPLQQPNQQQQEQPQQQPLDKHAWTAAGKHLERAAALAQYLRTDIIVTSSSYSSSYSSRASASAVSAAAASDTSFFSIRLHRFTCSLPFYKSGKVFSWPRRNGPRTKPLRVRLGRDISCLPSWQRPRHLSIKRRKKSVKHSWHYCLLKDHCLISHKPFLKRDIRSGLRDTLP